MLEFHRPSREWLQVRCPCGHWTKEPVATWLSRAKSHDFEYWCDGNVEHPVTDSQAARLRSLIEHPGWE